MSRLVSRGRLLAAALVVAAATAVPLGGAGANPQAPAGEAEKTIAIVFPNASNPIVQIVLNAAKKQAKVRGYKLLINDPGNDLNKQVAAVQSYIQQGVGGIVSVVPEPKVFAPLVSKAKDADIAWVTYAASLPDEDAFVSWPHRQGGFLLGKEAASWIKKRGGQAEVAILTFEQGEWARQRRQGIEAALKQFAPKAKVVAKQDALLATDGIKVLSTVLQAHRNLNVVLAISDTATEGAYQAFVNAGKNPKDGSLFLGGLDGSKRAYELMLQRSMYRASAALDLPAIGRAVVNTSANIIENGRAKDAIVPYVLLRQGDRAKVQRFLQDWK